jgi:hypothetical protein
MGQGGAEEIGGDMNRYYIELALGALSKSLDDIVRVQGYLSRGGEEGINKSVSKVASAIYNRQKELLARLREDVNET